jgi:hypothetical protein
VSVRARAPARPESALAFLAELLRAEGSELSPFVAETEAEPALGLLAAAGPRAAAARGEYAALIEAVREGYLLHYGEPRIVDPPDPDLALLGGDYLYALGLERLAELGDTAAVAELADLISLSAQAHSGPDGPTSFAAPLWLAEVTAVAVGVSPELAGAKEAARAGSPEAAGDLAGIARKTASDAGIGAQLERAAETVGFALPDLG